MRTNPPIPTIAATQPDVTAATYIPAGTNSTAIAQIAVHDQSTAGNLIRRLDGTVIPSVAAWNPRARRLALAAFASSSGRRGRRPVSV